MSPSIRVSCSLTALLLVLGCARAEPKRYNVLLITLDTLRADHVGVYGSRSGATPNLDALAARGVRFDNTGHARLTRGAPPRRSCFSHFRTPSSNMPNRCTSGSTVKSFKHS